MSKIQEETNLMAWAIHRTAVKLSNSKHPGPITDELIYGAGTSTQQFERILRSRIMGICTARKEF